MDTQKIIVYKNKLDPNMPVVLTFSLTANNIVSGSYTLFDDGKEQSEQLTEDVVSGTGTTQLYQLFRTEHKNRTYDRYLDLIDLLNKKILLYENETNNDAQYGAITAISDVSISYSLNIDTNFQIDYVDFYGGGTIFSYKRKTDVRTIDPPHFIVYEGIQEEPKIISDVFIERGTFSGFDNFKRLKQIKSLSELIKYGNGYFNVTTKATDIITK